ncbi:MAG: sensor histidine kinase [Ornithinibacter sp.]
MSPRLGLRSRILALTMPIVILVSAATAGIIYVSIGQVLEASARDIAAAEALELRTELTSGRVDDLGGGRGVDRGIRVSQVVGDTGTVVMTTDDAVRTPMADPEVAPGQLRVTLVDSVPGLDEQGFAVAAADALRRDGRRYTVLVAVSTRAGAAALKRSTEFALIGAIGLVALLGAVTTFAVGQALRPVERMRDQVESIAGSRPAPVLEVPPGGDELARLAETLNRVLERLRGADVSRRAFVSDAGHELRSPLATIRVLLDRLAEDRPLEERRQVSQRASAEVDRLSVLVDDLLTLASADERALTIADLEVDLDDVVAAEAAVVRARGLPVEVHLEPARVRGDAARLGRVVRNLLENAERHRQEAVRLRLSRAGDQALLEVDNDGPSVPVEDRTRIFSRFVRLDDSRTRETGGAGLGLAIVAEVVAAHGGTVEADESPDGWCRFAVRLPLDQ